MNCPNCNNPTDPSGTCLACAGQRTPSMICSMVRPALSRKVPVSVDLAITIDRTGSSQHFIQGIPLTVKIILEQVAIKAAALKVHIQSHGDEEFGEKSIVHASSVDLPEALATVALIPYSGGKDAAETHLQGISDLMSAVAWPAFSTMRRGVMIAVINDLTKPLRDGRTPEQLAQEITAKGLDIFVIGTRDPIIDRLTSAAGGMFFEISNTPNPAELQRIAAKVAQSVLASIVMGKKTMPMGAPAPSAARP